MANDEFTAGHDPRFEFAGARMEAESLLGVFARCEVSADLEVLAESVFGRLSGALDRVEHWLLVRHGVSLSPGVDSLPLSDLSPSAHADVGPPAHAGGLTPAPGAVHAAAEVPHA